MQTKNKQLTNGKVCIAAITSCTNTSNPAVLIMAGLVAKKARKLWFINTFLGKDVLCAW